MTAEQLKLGFLIRKPIPGGFENAVALGKWLHRFLPGNPYEVIYNHEGLNKISMDKIGERETCDIWTNLSMLK